MKKLIFVIALSLFGIMVGLTPALAVTNISFSPTSITVKQGQTFILSSSVNPKGIKNYTVKLELNYPADLLEVKSFTFGSGWMALSQPGYDSIDNANGILIKTAGYTGGLSSAASFGTISFLAKKAGSGVITVGDNSLALDSTNENVLGSMPQVSVVVTPLVLPTTSTTKASITQALTPTTKAFIATTAPTTTTTTIMAETTTTTTTLALPILVTPISEMNPLLAALLGIISHLNPWFMSIITLGSFGGAVYLTKIKK